MPVRALLLLLLPIGLLLTVAMPASAAGITILNLQDPVSTRQLGPSMQSWCDGNATASLAEARQAPYQPVNRQQINFGYRRDACWFRVRFVNTGHDELALWLQVDYAVLDQVDFYLVDENGVSFSRMGDTLPFNMRPVKIRSFTLPFTLQPAVPRTLYLRIHTLTSAMTVPVSLIGREPFIEQQSTNEWLMGGFYGIALGLLFYHLVLWLGGKEKSSRFYVLHVASATLYVATLQGILHRLWMDDWVVPQSANHMFGYLTLLSGLLFARDYLHTRQWQWLDRLLLATSCIHVGIIIALLSTPPGTVAAMQGGVALITLALLLLSGLFSLFQGRPEARIFVLAWSMFLVTVMLLALGAYGAISLPGLLNVTGVQIGLVMQQVLLSFGLAGRLRTLKNESLQRQQEIVRAQAENDAKSDFLAKMSHEIRTPMNAVLGLADLLRGTRMDATQRNYVETIYSAGGSLLNVINDILDFSKISSGKLQLEVSSFNLHRLLEDCLMIFHANAENKDLRLISDWDDQVPEWVEGDPTRLRQILLNLLSNAVKFTEAGTITLRARAADGLERDTLLLSCQVIDEGIGMNRQELGSLFQSFQQADSSTSRKYGGTGLGLAISRQLAELMKGNLEANSKKDKGSTFTLTVPLRRSNKNDSPQERSGQYGTEGMNVLVVEDNAVNQMVIGALLKKLSVSVTLASCGEEALELLQNADALPDLVLMDCEMPGLDGYETTRLLRRLEQQRSRPPLPVVALTAHATTEHRERCFACGMNDHVAKPVTLEQLKEKLLEWSASPDTSAH